MSRFSKKELVVLEDLNSYDLFVTKYSALHITCLKLQNKSTVKIEELPEKTIYGETLLKVVKI
jgi:hypothetical protein